MEQRANCLTPECQASLADRGSARGLCHRCYQAAREAIRSGRVAEAALIQSGKITPGKLVIGTLKRSRGVKAWFLS